MSAHSNTLLDLEKALAGVLLRDRFRLRRRLGELRKNFSSKEAEKIAALIERSSHIVERRKKAVPVELTYDETLPVCERRQEITEAILANQVIILCGETGSGKSTQLPKICLEAGRGVLGTIGHTQPRRVAARSIAARVAEELGTSVGQKVGFKIRFSDETDETTLVKLMTDGILLAETQSDRFLEQYDTLIIDEVHERSLNIDFLLGILKRLLPKRPELKLVITSATLDAGRFAEFFSQGGKPAPIIEVQGRTYPVEVRHEPPPEENPDWLDAAVSSTEELILRGSGDILLFLPTERDIHEAAKLLRARMLHLDKSSKRPEVLPLYARLPASEQQKIFKPRGQRRIVLATNVAESSVTVPRIKYVVDPGLARISRYSRRSRTQRLPIERVSQASADQRAGRCGRVGPGICVRLYSEEDYLERERYTVPEIQRSSLASVILQAISLRLGDVYRFPFLEPPPASAFREGFKTLFELGAVDAHNQLTPLGRQLSRLPVDPRIGRMLLAAAETDCLNDVATIAAVLEIRDPRDRPIEQQGAADEAHKKFRNEQSDFISMLNVWNFYHDLKEKLSNSQLRKACRENFLNFQRMREWADIRRQLLQQMQETRLKTKKRVKKEKKAPSKYQTIHTALLTGLLSSIASKAGNKNYEYKTADTAGWFLWPGSGLFGNRRQADSAGARGDAKQGKPKQENRGGGSPDWLVVSELVETTKRYLRGCAKIDPGWVEPIASHLVNYSHSDPAFNVKRGEATVSERVTLYGHTLVQGRRVALAPLDPVMARKFLIREGLVDENFKTRADFHAKNLATYQQAQSLEKKLRRHDLLRGEEAMVEFYLKNLPDFVFDRTSLERWWKKANKEQRKPLFIRQEDLVAKAVEEVKLADFPEYINAPSGSQLNLDYNFLPGSEEDGVQLLVPVGELATLKTEQLDWLIPGRYQEKVIALIKSLPKQTRRRLVPAPDVAARVVRELPFGEGPMLEKVADKLSQIAGFSFKASEFRLEKIPKELVMNVQVVDGDGEILAQGRDLTELRSATHQKVAATISQVQDDRWSRENVTTWDFGDLPESVFTQSVLAYPALVDAGTSVRLALTETLELAEQLSWRGVTRLVAIAAKKDLRGQVAWLPDLQKMELQTVTLPHFDLRQEAGTLIVQRAIADVTKKLPRDEESFSALVSQGRTHLGRATSEVASLLPRIFSGYQKAKAAVENLKGPRFEAAVEDMNRQLLGLTATGFLCDTPWGFLNRFQNYFLGIVARIDALRGGGGSKDAEWTEMVQAEELRFLQKCAENQERGIVDPELEHLRWMLEEFRISLFAQKMRTLFKVSQKRIEKQWEKIA